MINNFSYLKRQTENLEQEIELLKLNNKKEEKSTNCVCINKNFSNLEVILPKKILLGYLNFSQTSSLYFQGQINIFLTQSESVEISLIVNNISIQKLEKNLVLGNNQINIFCNFTPILTENAVVFIKITPKNKNSIYIQEVSFFIWGMFETQNESTYQALELNNNYLISFLSSNNIYYKIIPKEENEFCFNEFENLDIGYGFSFAYSKESNQIFLFRINLNGDLFYSKLNETEEYLISKISYVSAISLNNILYVFCISDGKCLYFEIDELGNMSLTKTINTYFNKLVRVNAFYNDYNNKIYVNISDSKNSNYLMEQTIETTNVASNISASYSLTINTYEDIWI